MKQIDIFGNEIDLQELQQQEEATRASKMSLLHKFSTMQQMYGILEGNKCKDCEHFIRNKWNKTYFKCGLWKQSNSSATDIRANQTACAKYVEGVI